MHRRYITTTSFTNTVKPVYNDHSWDQMIVVSVDRWSMCGGALVQLKWAMNQPTMVSMDMWSSYASGLQDRFHCRPKGGGEGDILIRRARGTSHAFVRISVISTTSRDFLVLK